MPLLKIKPPYANTESDPEKTIADINRLLKKYGINDYQWTTLWDQRIIELKFVIEVLAADGKSKKVAIKVSPPIFAAKRKTWDIKKGHYVAQELPNYSQAMRLLFYWLKTKIESVAFGLREVQEEFLSDVIVRGPDGRETTVGKMIRPQLTQGSNGVADVLGLPERKSEGSVVDAEWKEAD